MLYMNVCRVLMLLGRLWSAGLEMRLHMPTGEKQNAD